MSIFSRPSKSESHPAGLGVIAGTLICVASLVFAPAMASAEESPPPEAATAPAEPVAPAEPAAPPAPAAPLTVVTTDAPVESVLASEVEEPTVTLFAAEAPAPPALPAPGDPCAPAVCIDNGTILLAVNPTGELNTSDATGSKAGAGDAGLEYLPTGNDATSPGCLCEGWGVADPASGVWGGANIAELGAGGANLTIESFEWTTSTAKSVVLVNNDTDGPVFRVTHEYVPSPLTPNLYQVNVSIQNLTGETIAVVQYRRVMDWDIEPTAFDEYVTMNTGTASAITFTSNDGFASSNPLTGPADRGFTGDFTNAGPDDHGALFDFTFGPLAPGQILTFITYYGAAGNEAAAIDALRAVGAEAYSFGKPNVEPLDGSPNTFIFAFGNVGGGAIFPTDPAPEVIPAVLLAPTPRAVVQAVQAAPVLAETGGDPGTAALGALSTVLFIGAGAAVLWAARRRSGLEV